jgi:hypothetical protein
MKSRRSRSSVEIPTADAVIRGCEAFARHEPRDAMYRVTTFLASLLTAPTLLGSIFWGCLGLLIGGWQSSMTRVGATTCHAKT